MAYELNSAAKVRAAFWHENPTANRRRVRNYPGTGTMHDTDTRCAFVDWLDDAHRDGRVSDDLAHRVTLS